MEHAVRVRGTGRVEMPAYGLADAEHLVEKEIRAAWPEARVEVLDVARPGGASRIVEDFTVAYRITGTLAVDAESPASAQREAFRALRGRFGDTRYHAVRWDPADPPRSSASPPAAGEA